MTTAFRTTGGSCAKSGNKVRSEAGTRGKEILRFLLAGGLNTALTYLIYLAAMVVVTYQVAYAIAYAAGILVSYWVSLRFVFRQIGNRRKLARYPLVYALQYGVGAAMLEFLVGSLSMHAWIAPLIVVALTLPLTFVLSKCVLSANDKQPP